MFMASSHSPGPAATSVAVVLLPVMAVVLIAFLIIGLALPVLPLHVHQGLGLGTFVVGLVTGSQFAASLISRVWSGHYSDSRGSKRAVIVGLVMATGAGLLYLLSLLVAPLRPVAPQHRGSPAFAKVIGAIWVPGIGLAFSSIGFGAITAFISLLFVDRGWSPAWLAFSAFASSFMMVRMFFGHLPDRLGGAKVALVSVLIEAAGQALIWLAPGATLALTGAVLTGAGYSLVYPGFGIEAVHSAPPESRGLAMGAYTAFLDLALGITSPLLGLIASGAGLGAVFFASTVAVLGAAVIAVRLMRPQPTHNYG
jgi:MFS family permease